VPMWLLFEVGLVLSRILLRRRAQLSANDSVAPIDKDSP
jgi:Sec-independent protein secretion pathway component TatC